MANNALEFLNGQLSSAKTELQTFEAMVTANPSMASSFQGLIDGKKKQISDLEHQIALAQLSSSKKAQDTMISTSQFREWIENFLKTASYDFEVVDNEGNKEIKVTKREKSCFPSLDELRNKFNTQVKELYKRYQEYLTQEKKTKPNFHITFSDWSKAGGNGIRMTSASVEKAFRLELSEINSRMIKKLTPESDPLNGFPDAKEFCTRYEQYLQALVDQMSKIGYSPLEKERLVTAIAQSNSNLINGQTFFLRELVGNHPFAVNSTKIQENDQYDSPWGFPVQDEQTISEQIKESLEVAGLLDKTDIVKVIPSGIQAEAVIISEDSEDSEETIETPVEATKPKATSKK